MSKPAKKAAFQPVILTANRLVDGTPVFLDFEGAWSEVIDEAAVAQTPDEVRALEDRGAFDAQRNLVVEPYLVDVRQGAGLPQPLSTRERVRAAGPSILADVPGYVAPPLIPSPRLRGEGQGEGQPRSATDFSAPHPNPLPAKYGEREQIGEAA